MARLPYIPTYNDTSHYLTLPTLSLSWGAQRLIFSQKKY